MKPGRHIASFAAAITAVFVVSMVPPAAAQYSDRGGAGTGTSSNGGNRNDGGSRGGGSSVDINAIAILSSIFSHRHRNESDVLMKDGPQVLQYSSSTFAVRGFIGGGWPLYVDYELDAPAHVTVTVDAGKKSQPFSMALPGGEGPRTMKIELPANLTKGVQPGTIVVAVAPGGTPDAPPPHLHILGISCGPGAVGSDGVQDARFNQESISLDTRTPATYQFGCLFPFQTVVSEIVRIAGDSQKTYATVVHRKKLFDRKPVPTLPSMVGPDAQTQWNGRDGKSRKSLGRHELEIFAWQNAANPKSWSYGASQDFLQVTP